MFEIIFRAGRWGGKRDILETTGLPYIQNLYFLVHYHSDAKIEKEVRRNDLRHRKQECMGTMLCHVLKKEEAHVLPTEHQNSGRFT